MRATVRIAIVIGALALASIPSAAYVTAQDHATPQVDPHLEAAQRVHATLSDVERAGQLVMTSIPASRLRARDARQLRMLRPGGVILFARNHRTTASTRRLTAALQQTARGKPGASRPGLLVSIDQEGGIVKRIRDIPPTRSHPQLGARTSTRQTRAQARATGRALAARGINMNLAPVADLDIGPRRVMAARSFGRSPRRVGQHVAAFVRGLEQQHVAASVKHFPGFGGASVNSDDALATIGRTASQLRSRDLAPFRAAIDAGADSIMMSHGVYRHLDRRRPASASPAAYRLLRQELGYDGVAITDALHASGFTAATRGSVARGCVTVVAAGADIALLTGSIADAMRCRAALLRAMRAGTLTQARVDEAVLRVLTLKSRLGLLPSSG